MSKIKVHLFPLHHRGEEFIKVSLPNTAEAKAVIRSVTGRKWSQTHRCWYVPRTSTVYAELQEKFKVIIENVSTPQNGTLVPEKEVFKIASVNSIADTQPKFIEFKHLNGVIHKRVIGDKIILLPEKETRFKVFIPFDKKGWISAVKDIPGRAWNSEESYWSVPYVKDSFRRIWALGKENISLTFVIRIDIPNDFVMPKKENRKKNKPQIILNEMQQAAMNVLEEKFILEHKAWRTRKSYLYLFKKFLHFILIINRLRLRQNKLDSI